MHTSNAISSGTSSRGGVLLSPEDAVNFMVSAVVIEGYLYRSPESCCMTVIVVQSQKTTAGTEQRNKPTLKVGPVALGAMPK
jgi:hypothetical protein